MTKEELEQIKLDHVNNYIKLYNENKELVTLYDKYINNVVELFDFIKKDGSDFYYAIIFNILIEIGFFSADNNFTFHDNIDKELMIRLGMNIINGNGACRNLASFYKDVFSYFYNYPLTLACIDNNFEQNKDTKLYGNHVINLAKHNDAIYGFDLTNHCAFNLSSDDTLNEIITNRSLSYAPGGDILLQLQTLTDKDKNIFEEIDIKRKYFMESINKKLLTKEEFDQLVAMANQFVIERKELLKGFLVKNVDLTHEIKKKILLLK